jgi:hypothetical protein
MLSRRKRSERLREQFGPEYERSVSKTGDRKAAETDLKERQQRTPFAEVPPYTPLTPCERRDVSTTKLNLVALRWQMGGADA